MVIEADRVADTRSRLLVGELHVLLLLVAVSCMHSASFVSSYLCFRTYHTSPRHHFCLSLIPTNASWSLRFKASERVRQHCREHPRRLLPDINYNGRIHSIISSYTTVRYIHRTARDYLEGADVWASVLKLTENRGFQPLTVLARSSVLQSAMPNSTRRRTDAIWRVMVHSHSAGRITGESGSQLLYQFEKNLASFEMFHGGHCTAHFVATEHQLSNPFLGFAALFGFTMYVR